MTISKKEREAVNSTDKKFYITVFGRYDSAYILTAYYTSRNNDYLLFGETMSGSILNDELVNFRLNLYGSGSSNITLDLISETGNADLVIKQCNSLEKHKCRITKDDVLSKNSVAQNSTYFFLYSDNYGGKDSIRFLFNEADCHIEIEDYDYGKINICTYQIGVYGNSTSTLSSHYSLIAKHSNTHTILIEGTPIRSSLEINEYEFYKFNVQNDTNIDSLSFVVTNIGGDVTVFSSRKIKFPNSTTYDMASFFEMDPCTYKKIVV